MSKKIQPTTAKFRFFGIGYDMSVDDLGVHETVPQAEVSESKRVYAIIVTRDELVELYGNIICQL